MASQASAWEPVQRQRTHELVMSQIEAQLRSGQLQAGDQLPSERDLAARLGISRASLRESLRVLESLGVIEIRVGGGPDGGTVIRRDPGSGFISLLQLELAMGHFDAGDVLGTRIALEEWSCGYAAANGSASDIEDLRAILDQMDDPDLTYLQFNELDTAFHVRIAQVGGNKLIAHLMSSLRMAIRKQMQAAYERLEDWQRTAIVVRAEHRQILEAISDHDETLARTLIREHVESFYHTNVDNLKS